MTAANSEILVQCQRVVFRNRDIPLVGLLWLPSRFTASSGHPAIVLATPASAVKEQVGASYARRIVELGHIALTFDPSFHGESGGRPRERVDPASRTADLVAAVDFLSMLPLVDADRIGLISLGAGRDHAERAANTDRRVRALGHLAPVDGVATGPGEPKAVALALLRMEAMLGEWLQSDGHGAWGNTRAFETAANDRVRGKQAIRVR